MNETGESAWDETSPTPDTDILIWQSPPVPPEVLPSPFGEDTE